MALEVQCPYCGTTRSIDDRDICCRDWGNAMRNLNQRQNRHRELVLILKVEELEADLASRRRPGRPKKTEANPDTEAEDIQAEAAELTAEA